MRSFFGHAEHLVRVAVLFVAAIAVFLVAQALFVPEGFGDYGHFRPGALVDSRAHPLVFAGRAACVECHSDVPEAMAGGAHATVHCEACHGPLERHAEDPSVDPGRPDAGVICARCHSALVARPVAFPQVDVGEHAGGESCLSCHVAHRPGIE
jgi:hypothetical protein